MDDFSLLQTMSFACNQFIQAKESITKKRPIPKNDIFRHL